jgi:alkaline phosphatase D
MGLALWPFSKRPILAQPGFNSRTWKTFPFKLGVASGAPRADSVILWTRLIVEDWDRSTTNEVGESILVRWEVFADEHLSRLVASGEQLTDQFKAHSVHVKVQGLKPSTRYWYRFMSGQAVSDVGETKTAPTKDDDTDRLKFALASCQNYEAGHYTAYQDMMERELDFVLFVGDYIYETNQTRTNPVRQHNAPEPVTLDEYRSRYVQYKLDPLLQAAHAKFPWILMWDDHEVVNDYANDTDPAFTNVQDFLKRRAAAYQAYFEHQPIEFGPLVQSPYGASMPLNDSFTWGKLAQLWTLDCRQYRSNHACSRDGQSGGRLVLNCDELDQPHRTMLGFNQERWLTSGLSRAPQRWKLLAQATQISSTKLPSPLGELTYTEAWDGYPQARKRLLQSIDEYKVSNVVTLGGDVHMNVIANLRLKPNDLTSAPLATEIVTTSLTSLGLSNQQTKLIKAFNKDIAHMQADERGYTLIDVNREQLDCQFRVTASPALAGGSFATQAQFRVEAGRVGAIKTA